MRRFPPDFLTRIARSLFEASGCSAEDAATVADHLVESSLFGHDSHGTIRIYEYVDQMADGTFDPAGKTAVVRERGAMAVLDGGGALGQVAGRHAVDKAVELARIHGVGSVGLRNCCHLGRIGAYTLAAARQGLIGMAWVNAGRLGRQIPPYGGIDGKLSTNPVSFAAPRRGGDPILVDMTTSVVAEGKIRLAHNQGVPVPEGWITDAEGRPTTDPADFVGPPQGAILPLGGVVAYKGYCLSMMVEILGGLLSGEGCAAGAVEMRSNGLMLIVWDPAFFCEDGDYDRELEGLAAHVASSRVDPKVGRIQLPGSPEFTTAAERRRTGIAIDDTTWSRICDRARRLGLDPGPWEEEVCRARLSPPVPEKATGDFDRAVSRAAGLRACLPCVRSGGFPASRAPGALAETALFQAGDAPTQILEQGLAPVARHPAARDPLVPLQGQEGPFQGTEVQGAAAGAEGPNLRAAGALAQPAQPVRQLLDLPGPEQHDDRHNAPPRRHRDNHRKIDHLGLDSGSTCGTTPDGIGR